MIKTLLAVGIGSFIGGISRFLLSGFFQSKPGIEFPTGTFIVNILGCLLIGVVYGFADKGNLTEDWRLFLATGVLGGFTTFSAFSYETMSLLRNDQPMIAVGYAGASIFIGISATFIGFSIVRQMLN
ncbi:MAG: camphor resistance protein CrcB [Flavobacterium sp. BFFFF1]|uniref:fluoride efflux transporter CrcB n=1 Tax=unclassified Flavobacterium TaxID=196869 RepID=UPI000BCC0F30|nr:MULTISPECIES: fluoride efflux transporter CrcB [unclassified Flavobacterium]OYU80854.1 MAG: camphor resistance protein CrcB [Flavobacterium sp. BFFFF1]